MTEVTLDPLLLAQAMAESPQGLLIVDLEPPTRPVTFVNRAFCRLVEVEAEELLGRDARTVLASLAGKIDENAEAIAELRAAFKKAAPVTVSLRQHRRNQTTAWNELTLTPLPGASGQPAQLLVTLTDTTRLKDAGDELARVQRGLARRVAARTADLRKSNESLYEEILERRKAERALRTAERKYRSIFENAIEGVYQSTPDGRYLSVNPALARLYGFDSVEQMMTSVADIAQDVYVDPGMRARFQETIERDGEVRNLEYEVRRRDGKTIWISENARLVRDRRGRVLYYEGTVQDITRRRGAEIEAARLQQQLLQSQKMEAVGTLAGGIAHDFNNLLAAILGFTEMAVEDVPVGSEVQRNLLDALNAGRRAKELVRQILAFSRQSQPERKPVEVGAVVHEALKLIRPALPAGVRIAEEIVAANDHAIADPVQLQQVIINLGTNAGHAMREKGGELHVKLESVSLGAPNRVVGQLPPGRYLKLSVRDTGKGMSPAVLARIFEPFFTTKPVGEGTGLGLSVAHGIAKSHGGEIEVESAVGVGSTFTLYLPETREGSVPAPAARAPRRGGGQRILVVDDEVALAQMLQQRLERLGYEAHALTGSVEALHTFAAGPAHFDLVITDHAMPEMSGLQFAGALRRVRSDIPIVLCTGRPQEIAAPARELGAVQALLIKPVETVQLSEVLDRLLGSNGKA